MPQTVVGGINTSVDSNVSVDDQYVYWLTGGGATQSLIRTPKAGGMPVNLGSASGPAVDYAYTVGDPIYFIDNQGVGDQRIDSMPANGGTASPVVHAMQGLLLAANSTQVIYMTPDDNLRIHVLPTTSSPTAHSPGYIDADDHYVYLSHDGQLQRYAIADSSRAVLGDFETVSNSLLAIRAFAGRVYLLVGDPMASVRVERVESDGSGKTVVVDPASDFWTVAGDSVYYDFGGNVYRICR